MMIEIEYYIFKKLSVTATRYVLYKDTAKSIECFIPTNLGFMFKYVYVKTNTDADLVWRQENLDKAIKIMRMS